VLKPLSTIKQLSKEDYFIGWLIIKVITNTAFWTCEKSSTRPKFLTKGISIKLWKSKIWTMLYTSQSPPIITSCNYPKEIHLKEDSQQGLSLPKENNTLNTSGCWKASFFLLTPRGLVLVCRIGIIKEFPSLAQSWQRLIPYQEGVCFRQKFFFFFGNKWYSQVTLFCSVPDSLFLLSHST